MADRQRPHNGRDRDGRFKVKQDDVDDLLLDPEGVDYLRDDVRLGGAVEDTGADAGQAAERVERAIDENRYEVDHLVGRDRQDRGQQRPAGSGQRGGRGRRSGGHR